MKIFDIRHAREFFALFLILVTAYALLAVNPGLFWDDWVWPTQSASESVLVGRQLGVWWAGYFNNWVYSIESFSYVFRALSITGWLISSAAFCYILSKCRILNGGFLYVAFALIAISHATLFRVVNSIAMYCVYLAFFWCACAVLVRFGRTSWPSRLIAAPLFICSFYLNSLFVMYAAVLATLAWPRLLGALDTLRELSADNWRKQMHVFCLAVMDSARGFCTDKKNWLWLALPIVFYAVKWATTVKSDLYGTYNAVGMGSVLSATVQTLAIVPSLIREYWTTLWKNLPREQNYIFILLAVLVVRFFWNGKTELTVKGSVKLLLVGLAVVYLGALPYVAVGKPPSLVDLYESRHGIVAIPGLAIVFLALINLIVSACVRHILMRSWLRVLGSGLLIGLSVSYSVSFGAGLWWDWLRQESLIGELTKSRELLKDASMVLVRDYSKAAIFQGRKIWNYEYTGAVQRVIPGQTLMAVDVEEYGAWGIEEAILSDEKLRLRYNIQNVSVASPHAILQIDNKTSAYLTPDLLAYLGRRFLDDGAVSPYESKFFYTLSWEYVEVKERVRDFSRAQSLLKRYKEKHGQYPISARYASSPDSRPVVEVLYQATKGVKIAPPPSLGHIPGIPTDAWNPDRKTVLLTSTGNRGFQYWSNGKDYKLAYVGAPDYAYAKQAFPQYIDPARESYAIWTEGAYIW